MKSEERTLLTNRENLYRFLSRIYITEVDQSLLESLKFMDFPDTCFNAELSDGFRMLEEYLENCGNDPLDDLAVDYAKVFLGAGIAEGTAAFPYESVYTSKKRIMMQDARDEVVAIYATKGLETDDKMMDLPEDHIAVELEFMAFLCRETQFAQDVQNDSVVLSRLKEQRDFLHSHLLNWVPAFCLDVEKNANTGFYKGIGKITMGYLNLDGLILQSLIG